MNQYDTIIIGAGPAGLSAALYSGRALLNTLLISMPGGEGGQITSTEEVENYPGSISDNPKELADRMKGQAIKFGVEIKEERVESVSKNDEYFNVATESDSYKSKTVIIATGSQPRELGCKGESEFKGLGVSYCATCDANFFRGLSVVVVGGGDAAVEEGIYLTKFASKVTLVHRRDKLRAAKSLQQKAFHNPKMDFVWDSVVKEIRGDGVVKSVVIENVKTNQISKLNADGVFVFIGYKPDTGIFSEMVELDKTGNIITDENMCTSVPGLFAAGDVRRKMLKQVVTAAADGAIAAVSAEKYISEHFE